MTEACDGDFTPYPTFPLGGLALGLARYVENGAPGTDEELLAQICRFVLNESGTFEPDGRFMGHTHSGGILLTSAVAAFRWGVLTGNDRVTAQMKQTLDWTCRHSSSWGWVLDGLGAESSACETCSLTDAIHLAVLVARHLDPAYYDVRWRGNTVVDLDPRGAIYPLFEREQLAGAGSNVGPAGPGLQGGWVESDAKT